MSTKIKIEQALRQKFHVKHLDIQDDSDSHAGHAEAKKSGGGHFSVLIVADEFEGVSAVKRHRMIYDALQKELKSGIHALAIKALTEEEY